MRTTAIIIGAGHAGLAMSRCLTAHAIDHVILERGEVANSWKTERWDSLRLLTPNWMSRLPGYGYAGDDPDGYRSMPETIAFLERYAAISAAPVQTYTTVTRVQRRDDGYTVTTNQGVWHSRALVLASGACNIASVPAFAEAVPSTVDQLTAMTYRHPSQLAEGGVLIVGAAGVFDEGYDDIDNLARARRLPSMQLLGSATRRSLDLNTLTDLGVQLIGRFAGIRDGKAQFSGSLQNMCTMADLKMDRLLEKIDTWVTTHSLDSVVSRPQRFEPTRVAAAPPLSIDLHSGAIQTILWATGYRPGYTWLDVPVLDAQGRLRHDGGVVASPGMYVIGLPVLRCRRSTFIDGAASDARYLSAHLAAYLDKRSTTDLQSLSYACRSGLSPTTALAQDF